MCSFVSAVFEIICLDTNECNKVSKQGNKRTAAALFPEADTWFLYICHGENVWFIKNNFPAGKCFSQEIKEEIHRLKILWTYGDVNFIGRAFCLIAEICFSLCSCRQPCFRLCDGVVHGKDICDFYWDCLLMLK